MCRYAQHGIRIPFRETIISGVSSIVAIFHATHPKANGIQVDEIFLQRTMDNHFPAITIMRAHSLILAIYYLFNFPSTSAFTPSIRLFSFGLPFPLLPSIFDVYSFQPLSTLDHLQVTIPLRQIYIHSVINTCISQPHISICTFLFIPHTIT